MLIDTHCHVHFNAFRDDMDDVVRSALAEGVRMIAVGTEAGTSAAGIALAERYEGVWATIGLHPSHVFGGHHDEGELAEAPRGERFDPAAYAAMAAHPKVVGVGEIGLDYHYDYAGVSPEEMKAREAEAFEAAARLAIAHDLPVVIHCRDAHEDQLALITNIWGPYKEGEPPRGVIHCFTGTRHDAERYLELGFLISFTGVITYPPRKSDVAAGKELLTDVVRWVPMDRFLVETDAPYLAPVPKRGERCVPSFVKLTAQKVAELKGIPFEDVAAATTANALRLFRKMRA